MDEQERKRGTAYHEAGHAVVAYVLGLKLRGVTIVPADGMAGLADVPFEEEYYYDSDLTADYTERQMACYFAGVVAEEELAGRELYDSEFGPEGVYAGDWRGVADCVLSLAGDDERAQIASSERGLSIARRVVQQNWASVASLAEELLHRESLDEAAVLSVLRAAERSYLGGALRPDRRGGRQPEGYP